MKKLIIPLVGFALATAGCAGTAASSTSPATSLTNASRLAAAPGGNTAADVSDLDRPNPPVHHAGAPATPTQPRTATNTASSTTAGEDRCSATALGSGSSLGPQAGTPGPRHLPPPMCPPE